jgi:hypothetical protein
LPDSLTVLGLTSGKFDTDLFTTSDQEKRLKESLRLFGKDVDTLVLLKDEQHHTRQAHLEHPPLWNAPSIEAPFSTMSTVVSARLVRELASISMEPGLESADRFEGTLQSIHAALLQAVTNLEHGTSVAGRLHHVA